MISNDEQPESTNPPTVAEATTDSLPRGSVVQDHEVRPSQGFQLLMIPAPQREDPELLTKARCWVDAAGSEVAGKCLLLALQGAQIVWSAERAAVVAQSDRMESVRSALLEFSRHEAELRDIEREISAGWPQLETDSPLAFEFDDRAIRRRPELARRFQQAISLRARLARLTPHVHRLPIHPPTLGSQVAERLRERARIVDRAEFAAGQLELFERVYELCGHRSSEFLLSRKGHLLEWIIIVLLATQTILLIVERLASVAS